MKKIMIIFFGVLFNVGVSQNITVNQTYTAQQLIENILVNSGCITVYNFSASGGNFGTSEFPVAINLFGPKSFSETKLPALKNIPESKRAFPSSAITNFI